MSSRSARTPFARLLRDLSIGLVLFIMLTAAVGGVHGSPATSPAFRPALGLSPGAHAGELGAGEFLAGEVLEWRRGPLAFLAPSSWASSSPTVYRTTTHAAALPILALAFSAVFAFNAWFCSHLCRVYASPRPGAWRGDGPRMG